MNRKDRRRQDRGTVTLTKLEWEDLNRKYQKEAEKIAQEWKDEASDVIWHCCTGRLLTAMAVVLRKDPYNWPADNVMELLDSVNGVTNALISGEIDDADLITEGEHYGIRVLWSANREYITDINVYEEKA